MSPIHESDFCFVILASGDRPLEIVFRQYDDKAQLHFQGVWQRMSKALQKHHELGQEVPAPNWSAWKPWDWCEEKKSGYEIRQKYVAWCGNNLVGFLNVWPNVPSHFESGQNLLYIEHLAASPGNLVSELWERRFRYVGTALFAYASLLSRQQGFEGRLGLHAADLSARKFYLRLQDKCSKPLFYPETTGVSGPTPHGEREQSQTYLETIQEGSAAWLEGYRRA